MNKKAFTLIEIIIAVFIFSLVTGITSSIFVSGIQAQRSVLATRDLLDQTSYFMEYISRAMRMTKKDLTGACLTTVGAGYNYESNDSQDRIRFLNYQDICQEFFLSGNELMERKSLDNTAANFGTSLNLTSDSLQVLSFNIGPSDSWDQDDDFQPRATLFLRIKGAGQKPETQPEIRIQTTISQRNLDIKK